MNLSFGYIKDCLAFVGFFILFWIFYFIPNIQFLKPFILLGLATGFIVDGYFTFNPPLHNKNITF